MTRSMTKVKYRYRLGRTLDPHNPRLVCWVMLNPSSADDLKDDPTMLSVQRISHSNGYGRVSVCNIFAIRTPSPAELKQYNFLGIDVWGGRKMVEHRDALFRFADDIVVAWGATDIRWAGFEPKDTLRQVHEYTDTPLCCGTNKGGSPKHPLYLPADTKLVPFNG